jgi:hypothetical protein
MKQAKGFDLGSVDDNDLGVPANGRHDMSQEQLNDVAEWGNSLPIF